YEEQGCAACHTIAGEGGAAAPPLTRIGHTRDADWLKKFLFDPSTENPDSEMPPYDDLTAEELEALVAYLQTLK
ncbi:MAG: c-type cytochrome, partial [bacterium]